MFSVAVANTMIKSNLGEKEFQSATFSFYNPSWKDAKRELKQKLWTNAPAGLIFLASSFGLLIQHRSKFLGMVPPVVVWTLPP